MLLFKTKSHMYSLAEKKYWEKLQTCYLKVLTQVSECRVRMETLKYWIYNARNKVLKPKQTSMANTTIILHSDTFSFHES